MLVRSLQPNRRSRDPAIGDFGDAKIIRKFGEVPDGPFELEAIVTRWPATDSRRTLRSGSTCLGIPTAVD